MKADYKYTPISGAYTGKRARGGLWVCRYRSREKVKEKEIEKVVSCCSCYILIRCIEEQRIYFPRVTTSFIYHIYAKAGGYPTVLLAPMVLLATRAGGYPPRSY